MGELGESGLNTTKTPNASEAQDGFGGIEAAQRLGRVLARRGTLGAELRP